MVTYLSEKQKAIEIYKCTVNPLYYIYNYVYIPESGGQILYSKDMMHTKLKHAVKALFKYHNVVLMATRQLGKALYINTLIPQLNNKWITMGDLKIGDIILDSKGNPTTVTFTTDIMYNHKCYEIIFSNNSSIIADEDHLWKVNYNGYSDQILSTKELLLHLDKELYIGFQLHDCKYYINSIRSVDSVPVKCIQVDSYDHMYLCGNYIPTHNTTLAAALLEWANNFHPYMKSIILTYSKAAAYETLDRIKFIHNNNPPFLRMKVKSRGDKKTYLEYQHGSLIRTFFTSGSTDPSKVGRAFSSPILYIDEAAHIRGIEEAYGAAYPILATAREQAKRNNYPYFLLVTSTPNGTISDGKFFYDTWSYATDSETIFDDTDEFVEDSDQLMKNPERNGYVRVYFHWSQDEKKTTSWYEEQCRGVNFNKRIINQEYDLLFVGSTQCLFDDDFLAKLKPMKPVNKVILPHGVRMNFYYNDFDSEDYYLLGTDSAKSLMGDYNALELFRYSDFVQMGEYFGKLGSVIKYTQVIMVLVQKLIELTNGRIILCIENNYIGGPIIEALELGELDEQIAKTYKVEKVFDYGQYIYTPAVDRKKILKGQIKVQPKYVNSGLNTNVSTKGVMVSHLYDFLVGDPARISSSDFIAQLNIIERKANGSVSAQSGRHDDLFMAAAFCAYVKRLAALEYDKLIGMANVSYQQFKYNQYKQAINMATLELPITQSLIAKYNEEENGLEYQIDMQDSIFGNPNKKDDNFGIVSDGGDYWGLV